MENLQETKTSKKRIENKLRNREQILNAARLVFLEIGYETCNIRDIIRRTNLASGTFYNYFKTKEEVFIALHDSALSRFRPHIKTAFEEADGDFGKFIYKAFLSYFNFKREELLVNSHNNKILTASANNQTPESFALFNEISTYLNSFCVDGKYCHINSQYLVSSCIGIAQELGRILVKDENQSAHDLAKFSTQFVIGGILNIK